MNTITIIVMLVRVSTGNTGGPLVIQGFETLEACERARPKIEEFYRDGGSFWGEKSRSACVSFPSK